MVLRRWKSCRLSGYLFLARLEKFKGEYLFPKDDQDYLLPAGYQLNIMHRETLDRIGFNFRLYNCRHTFATRALDSDVDLLTLASMLGHANLSQDYEIRASVRSKKKRGYKVRCRKWKQKHSKSTYYLLIATLLDTGNIIRQPLSDYK